MTQAQLLLRLCQLRNIISEKLLWASKLVKTSPNFLRGERVVAKEALVNLYGTEVFTIMEFGYNGEERCLLLRNGHVSYFAVSTDFVHAD